MQFYSLIQSSHEPFAMGFTLVLDQNIFFNWSGQVFLNFYKTLF